MRAASLQSGLLLLLVAVASATEMPLRVTSSRALRVTVVDDSKTPVAHHPMQREFIAALSAALGARLVDAMPLKADYAGTSAAAARMQAGECDAILFVGPNRPREFRRTDIVILAGNFGANFNFTNAYLVIAGGDSRVKELLTEAFPIALGARPTPERAFVARE